MPDKANAPSFEPREERVKDYRTKDCAVYYAKKYKEITRGALPDDVRENFRASPKDCGQIKHFVRVYGEETFKSICDKVFGRWTLYKLQWHIEGLFPSVGVLTTYGLSTIQTYENKDAELSEEEKQAIMDMPMQEGWGD